MTPTNRTTTPRSVIGLCVSAVLRRFPSGFGRGQLWATCQTIRHGARPSGSLRPHLNIACAVHARGSSINDSIGSLLS
jgi:hypothetical protein